MIVREIRLQGFRNLTDYQVSFHPGKNLIHGLNGAGKTSILESIFLPGFGKSFLSVKKSDIINDRGDQFLVRLQVADPGDHVNKITAHYHEKFTLLLNDKKTNLYEVNHYLYPLIFSSSDYDLYIRSKTYIRKLMDRFVFGLHSLYINYILSYNKALRQKNHLLKKRPDSDEISSWNKTMSEAAEKIVGIKMNVVEQLNRQLNDKFNNTLQLEYSPSLDTGLPFLEQLEKRKSREILYKRSLIGPHLDDFRMILKNKNLKFYSSGEKKIHLLMVYIAFIELFKQSRDQYPVFLVDDFDTAIDENNIAFLLENYPQLQVIATSVNKHDGFDHLIELTKEN